MNEEHSLNVATLAEHTAIVTGGTSGIGLATCQHLVRLKANVVVIDKHEARVLQVVDDLTNIATGERIVGFVCDVTDEAGVTDFVQKTIREFERVDILVHSAGVLRAPNSAPMAMVDMTVEQFDFVVDTNLMGTFLCNRAVLPTMFKQKSGQIINIASTSGRKGRPLDSAYCASKFGVIGLTESLAEEVRPFGIRVQLVLPDAVDTPLWEQNGPVAAPPWSMSADRIADVITYMLCLPRDVFLGEVAVYPMRTRKRRNRQDPRTEHSSNE